GGRAGGGREGGSRGGGVGRGGGSWVASAARGFVVLAAPDKRVDGLRPSVPLEILRFGARRTLTALGAELRDVPPSPDGNLIADYLGEIDDPAGLAAHLAATPGVVEHGLFPPSLVSDILVARGAQVDWIYGSAE